MNDCVYTFYVIGVDGTPMFPYKMSGQIDPVAAWTVNIEKAVTWNKIEDFDCLLPEFENPGVVAIYNKGSN